MQAVTEADGSDANGLCRSLCNGENWLVLTEGAVAKLLSSCPRDSAVRSSVLVCRFNQPGGFSNLRICPQPALPGRRVPCRAAASTHLHGKVSGDAADLDPDGSSVTVPCGLLDLLEVAGRYPTLVITLLVLLFLSTGPILRGLVLFSGLWANGDGLSFLGWRRQSAMGQAMLWSETRGARRRGSGSHQQLLQLLLDAGQGGSPVEK